MLGSLIRIALFLAGASLLLEGFAPFEVGGFIISQNKALTFVLLLLALVHWLFAHARLPQNDKTKWILAFYISLALSSIYSATQGFDAALLAVNWTTFLATVIFYFLLCYVVQTRRDLDLLFFALIVGGAVVSISAFFSEEILGSWMIRKRGLGPNANQLAGNLLAILPLTYALATTTRSSFKKGVLLGGAMLIVLGCVLAGSRAAFLAALFVGIAYFVRIKRMPDFRLVVATVLLVIVGVVASPEGYGDRLKTMIFFVETMSTQKGREYRDHDFGGRLLVYKASLVALATHPILGVGVERYQEWARTYLPRKSMDQQVQSRFIVHNAVLSVASQQGFLGLVPFLAILVLTYRDYSRAQRLARSRRDLRDPELEALYMRALMAQIGYLGMLVVIQFQPGTFWRVLWAMFALSTITLSLVQNRLSELAQKAPARGAGQPGGPLPGSFPQHAGALTRPSPQN